MVISLDKSGRALKSAIVAGPPEVKAGAKVTISAPAPAFACWIAARNVQAPVPSLQTPSAKLLSAPSPVELTVKVVAALAVRSRLHQAVPPTRVIKNSRNEKIRAGLAKIMC